MQHMCTILQISWVRYRPNFRGEICCVRWLELAVPSTTHKIWRRRRADVEKRRRRSSYFFLKEKRQQQVWNQVFTSNFTSSFGSSSNFINVQLVNSIVLIGKSMTLDEHLMNDEHVHQEALMFIKTWRRRSEPLLVLSSLFIWSSSMTRCIETS